MAAQYPLTGSEGSDAPFENVAGPVGTTVFDETQTAVLAEVEAAKAAQVMRGGSKPTADGRFCRGRHVCDDASDAAAAAPPGSRGGEPQ